MYVIVIKKTFENGIYKSITKYKIELNIKFYVYIVPCAFFCYYPLIFIFF